jgi:hypothetical protein
MKTSSCKGKGRRLQDAVVKSLKETYTSLRDGDIKPIIMGAKGRDVQLSPAAEDIIPFDIECKNTEKLSIWAALEQSESNKKEGRIPLLVFKRNHSKTYAVIEWERLLELLAKK